MDPSDALDLPDRDLLEGASVVLLDAGFTLIDSVRSVGEVYFEIGCSLADDDLDRGTFFARMKELWPRLNRDYRSRHPELVSSEEIERRAWHDFTKEVARPFPSLTQRHAEWLERLIEYFDQASAWKVAPGGDRLLEELDGKGIHVVIVSNWHSALERILAGLDLAHRCHAIVTSASAGRKKPHREIFDRALAAVQANADDAIHVGDSWEEDVEGALHAGIRPVWLCREASCPVARPGVPVIRSLEELLRRGPDS